MTIISITIIVQHQRKNTINIDEVNPLGAISELQVVRKTLMGCLAMLSGSAKGVGVCG